VLQENIILHGVRMAPPPTCVTITSSAGAEDDVFAIRRAPFHEVVKPTDPERFIHVTPDVAGAHVAETVERLPCSLADLGLTVSTGRVVDFRARELLRREPEPGAVPLIYPTHFDRGYVGWPKA